MDAKVHKVLGSKYAIDILLLIRDNPGSSISKIIHNFYYGAHTTVRKRIYELSDLGIICISISGDNPHRKEVILTSTGRSITNEMEYDISHSIEL